MDDLIPVGDVSISKARKRLKRKSKREIAYEQRYADKDPHLMNFEPPCAHTSGRFRCCAVRAADLVRNKRNVFSKPCRKYQDARLAILISTKPAKTKRPTAKKTLTINYKLKTTDGEVPVCSTFVQRLFEIGSRRLNTIAKGIHCGEGIKYRQGGDRKENVFGEKRAAVIAFISKLKARESHYNRKKSVRKYLPAELSINKLFNMYNQQAPNNLKVKKTFFQKLFSTKFNLGFGTPASDTCSFCARMLEKLRLATDVNERNGIIAELGAHKMRAKAFHAMMRETPVNSVSFSFDLQQVQPLPKLPIGEAFYLRQLSYYCLCITDIGTHAPVLYTWNESMAGRGSEEVGSALIDFLSKMEINSNISDIRFFSDGCTGQNKNQHVMHALCWWLLHKSPPNIKSILLVFPVRGHSYLPPDRVFGRIEKMLRKASTVISHEEYDSIYSETGEVRSLQNGDWILRESKVLQSHLKEFTGIMDMKRIYLVKETTKLTRGSTSTYVSYKMENTFRSDDPSKTLLRVAKKGHILPAHINTKDLDNKIKPEKIKDIKSLLTAQYGDGWEANPTLQFYVELVQRHCHNNVGVEEQSEEQDCCECVEEEPGIAGKI